jgi:hypothetical protein
MIDGRLTAAVRALASVCDGALEHDGRGYSKTDAYLGRQLADTPDALWPTALAVEAHGMLRKYRRQLAAFGFDYDTIPAPVVDEAHDRSAAVRCDRLSKRRRLSSGIEATRLPKRTIDVDAEGFLVRFPYLEAAVDVMRSLKPHARFDRAAQTWTVAFHAPDVARVLLDLAEDYDFVLSESAADRLRDLAAHPIAAPVVDVPTPAAGITLSADNTQLEVRYPWNPARTDALKRAVPTVRWDKAAKCWRVPLRWGSCEGLAAWATEADLTLGAGVADRLAALAAEHDGKVEASRAVEATDFPRHLVPEGLSLYGYQEAGIRYALDTKRLIIGDEMGLGKTVQALMTLVIANAFPAVVTCPNVVKLNWYRHARRWLPKDKTIAVIDGTRPGRAAYHADVVIVNWDVLHAHVRGLRAEGLRAAVFDEFHYAKNWARDKSTKRYKTRRVQAAADLAEGIEWRIGLTGTATVNGPDELIAPLEILGRIGDLGGRWFFLKRYCGARRGAYGWDFSGASNLDELHRKLRATCYVRREKADVLADLPEKRRVTVPLALANRDEYRHAAAHTAAWLREHRGKAPSDRAAQLQKIEVLMQLATAGKFDAAVDWICDMAEAEKLIVFAHHRDVQAKLAAVLAERGVQPVTLTGGQDAVSRQAAVDRFQSDPACRVVVASLMGAKEGWTGTAATNVVFLEFAWTPGAHKQAEDRAHRIGQRESVTAWYLVAERSIDEDRVRLLDEKRCVTDAVNAGTAAEVEASMLDALIASLTEAELLTVK